MVNAKGVIIDNVIMSDRTSGMIIKRITRSRKKKRNNNNPVGLQGIDVEIDGEYVFSLTIESKHHIPVKYPVYRIDTRK